MKLPLVIASLIAITGCVDPFATNSKKLTTNYVIEGGISNLDPPYRVTISNATNYSNNLDGFVTYVSNANVEVCDNEGNCIPFFETSRGRYQTAATAPRGIIGRTYQLRITMPDGSRILSTPEPIPEPIPISSVYYEFDKNTVVEEGFQVYVDTNDPAGERNYYRWETESYFPYTRYCFRILKESPLLNFTSDEFVNGNQISRFPVKNVPFTNLTYYVVQVYQHSISAKAYQFFNQVKGQLNSKGSIFDPPPTLIAGNLYSDLEENGEVLGYFLVSGASRADVAVDRSQTDGAIPRPFAPLIQDPLYCGEPCNPDCVSWGGGTCGNRPCPPDCASSPDMTNIAPDAWPLPHKSCD